MIKVDERRQTEPTFEEKEPELREQLAREIVTALLADVRKGATIERFNIDGTPKRDSAERTGERAAAAMARAWPITALAAGPGAVPRPAAGRGRALRDARGRASATAAATT